MEKQDTVLVPLRGELTGARAEGVAARIRAALSNGLRRFEFRCEPDTNLVSAELVGYLAVASAASVGAQAKWVFVNAPESVEQLFRLLGLEAQFGWRREPANGANSLGGETHG